MNFIPHNVLHDWTQEQHLVAVQLLSPDAKIPTKAHATDAGFDLYAIESAIIYPWNRKTIKTGIAIEMPSDMAGLIWPRSGLAVKQGVDVLAGVIDSGYRGEIMVCLLNTSTEDVVQINAGDRIAQIIFQVVPRVIMVKAKSDLTNSDRGERGFGSSDRSTNPIGGPNGYSSEEEQEQKATAEGKCPSSEDGQSA